MCVDITENFRLGQLSKIGAILELQAVIPQGEANSGRAEYVKVLDNFERRKKKSSERSYLFEWHIESQTDPSSEEEEDSDVEKNPTAHNASRHSRASSRGTEGGSIKRKVDTSSFA
jgi:hypothetical protein